MAAIPTLDDRVVRISSGLALAIPLLLYIPCIPIGTPPGDGAELLAAMYRLGVAHPSGYPLITILGAIASPLALGEPHFNSALLLCALPTALTSWLLFRTQQHLSIHWLPALLASLTWALASQTFVMATRLEVYALHALLLTNTLYCMLRYLSEPESPKWLVGAAIVAGLGMANHMTLTFMLPVLGVAALLSNWRVITDIRAVGAVSLALLGGLSLYLYLPLAAWLNDGAAPVWNNTRSMEAILHHISGEELRHQLDSSHVGKGLIAIWRSLFAASMPGLPLLTLFGVGVLSRRNWRWPLMVLLALTPIVVYTAAYTAPDVALYHTPLLAPLVIFMGAGIDALWRLFLKDRFPRGRHLVLAIVGVGIAFNLWTSRTVFTEQDTTHTRAEATYEALEQPAILIAEGELARPLWYQAYITRSDRERFVLIDAELLQNSEQDWYSAFLKERHGKLILPKRDTKGALPKDWREQIARANRKNFETYISNQDTQKKAPFVRALPKQ